MKKFLLLGIVVSSSFCSAKIPKLDLTNAELINLAMPDIGIVSAESIASATMQSAASIINPVADFCCNNLLLAGTTAALVTGITYKIATSNNSQGITDNNTESTIDNNAKIVTDSPKPKLIPLCVAHYKKKKRH